LLEAEVLVVVALVQTAVVLQAEALTLVLAVAEPVQEHRLLVVPVL